MAMSNKPEGFADVGEAKKSGYFYQGKEIITGRSRGRPPTYVRNPKFYPQVTKVDAATLYAVYGDTKQVSELVNVPESVIRGWKQEPWWIEIQKQVFAEQNEKLAARISGVLDKTITHLEERLEKGDEKINQKTGEIVSVAVEASVLAKMFESLAHQRRVTRGEPTSISAKIGVDDRLKTLEKAFLKFAQAREINHDEIEDSTDEEVQDEQEICDVEFESTETEEYEEDEFIEQDEVTQSAIKSKL